MSKTIQIRDVDDATYTTLRTRAARENMSLTAYVRNELAKLASGPTMAEWVERVTNRDWGVSGELIVQIQRELRDSEDGE
ncbi:MAG: FitA-like ribbon-helix-helix domain-containing protein [Sciscionella sp.]